MNYDRPLFLPLVLLFLSRPLRILSLFFPMVVARLSTSNNNLCPNRKQFTVQVTRVGVCCHGLAVADWRVTTCYVVIDLIRVFYFHGKNKDLNEDRKTTNSQAERQYNRVLYYLPAVEVRRGTRVRERETSPGGQ